MANKQTAIEWLIQELGEYFPHEIGGIHLMVEKAKQMEKEHIMMAYNDGRINQGLKQNKNAGQYYNETYGK